MSTERNGHRRELLEDVQKGGVTLVVGAGISMPRGVPSWPELVRWACKRVGYQPRSVGWLANDTLPIPNSLSLQIALEEVEHHLRSKHKRSENAVVVARREFAKLIAEGLYQSVSGPADDSLAILAEAIRVDQSSSHQRIRRIISFNADDMLEEAANEGHHGLRDPVVWPIARAHHHPRRDAGANGCTPIPIYHVHGYLPRSQRRGASDSLVFTDAQYWESAAEPFSIANRVFSTALHDSHCLFVGLSMTDYNINRWLGLHAHDVQSAKIDEVNWYGRSGKGLRRSIPASLRRHYWLRTDGDNQLMDQHMLRRGVVPVKVHDWTDDFRKLIASAFIDGR